MRAGDIITVEAGELVAGGAAMARVDGFPVFVTNAFPGDVARVRLVEVKKGFGRGEVVELLTPSQWRRAAPCPIADECGGCDWTALRLDKQLEAKRRILVESLRRIGKMDPDRLPEIAIHPSPLNYRIRSRFHHDGAATGFYAMRSNRVVPLTSACEVVGVETARLVANHPGNAPARPEDEIWELGGNLVTGDAQLTISIEGFTWRLGTRSFFQVNRHLLGTMIRRVIDHASRTKRRDQAVDLYAGVGFFTLPLARMFETVTMIEGSPQSLRWARENVPPNVRIVDAPVEQAMKRFEGADFVFLDPPRAGTRPEVVSAIAAGTREVIAYLSCDPVTFARDAGRLTASGWRLATLDLLDLFPNTHHVETLSSFERAQ
jgi:tRNA/tmRNA/rRNA uracil-C5-methylase (TrmA/RlmC/RlmD family)